MTDRIPCSECGALILPLTAERTGGLCRPCKGGFRQHIEASKHQNEQRRRYLETPVGKLSQSLNDRVNKTPQGFAGLSENEQRFYAIFVLDFEVRSGGFHQYFDL